MHRRRFLVAAILIGVARGAAAQAKSKRIAILTLGDEQSVPPIVRETLLRSAEKAGFREGRNFALLTSYAKGDGERLAESARRLARDKVDLIYAVNTPAAVAAKQATGTIPIVFVRVADPVGVKLVKSFSRPEGNVTGVVPFTPELAGKRLEILRQAMPRLSRVSVFWAAGNQGAAQTFRQFQEAGAKLGVDVHDGRFRSAAEVARVIGDAARAGCSALMLIDDVVVASVLPDILESSAKERLAVAAIYREVAEAGALMSYGPNVDEIYEAAADYAARILGGASPAALPVRQPSRFDLVINLKAAKALSLRMSDNLLSSAHKVIE